MNESVVSSHAVLNRGQSQQMGATLELVVAAAFWGFGFIASIWALEALSPLMVTTSRFLLAGLFGTVLVFFLNKKSFKTLNWTQFRLAFVPGFLISTTLIFQTWGLQYTTATKSGFITSLYVLIVPLLERFWLKRKINNYHFIYVGLALIGVAVICDLPQSLGLITRANALDNKTDLFNFGDLLTLVCSIIASFHILWFDLNEKKIQSAFTFGIYQNIWAGIIPILIMLVLSLFPSDPFLQVQTAHSNIFSFYPIVGLLILVFGSTLLAFTLQIRAQRVLAPSVASILFLLESPFAAIFALVFLHEKLGPSQWVGGSLILFAAFLTTTKLRIPRSLVYWPWFRQALRRASWKL